MLDEGHDTGGHEPAGSDRPPRTGHLGHLHHAARGRDLDPAACLGRRDRIGLYSAARVNNDLDLVPDHGVIVCAGRASQEVLHGLQAIEHTELLAVLRAGPTTLVRALREAEFAVSRLEASCELEANPSMRAGPR